MNIAITGSNGYVGNFLAEHLSGKGHKVTGIDLASMPRQREYKNFTFERCDIRDKAKIEGILARDKVTHVIHLAFLMDPQHDRGFEYDADVNGSKSIFDAAVKAKAKKFIHFSSASAYGGFKDNKPWITEDQPLRPRDWAYAQHKKIAEEYYNSNNKKTKLVQFRMCTAVGPSYYKPGGVVATLVKAPVSIALDGKDTELQFIHEDDVKRLTELVLNDSKIEGTYNLSPDSYATTKQLVPNKILIPIPKLLFKAIISLLWNLRIISVSPTSVNLVAHGIVISTKKLMQRYNYKFQYTTKEAFLDAVEKRRKNGTL